MIHPENEPKDAVRGASSPFTFEVVNETLSKGLTTPL